MIYDGAEMLVEAFQSFPTGKTKVKCTGMSEKFNPLQESCQIACVRACGEELKVTVSESGACKRSLVSNPTPSQRPRHLDAER
jgi:hypothetical protein